MILLLLLVRCTAGCIGDDGKASGMVLRIAADHIPEEAIMMASRQNDGMLCFPVQPSPSAPGPERRSARSLKALIIPHQIKNGFCLRASSRFPARVGRRLAEEETGMHAVQRNRTLARMAGL